MKTKIAFILLLIAGIIHRFYYQFIQPSFNVDEISLGKNLKKSEYLELLKPLDFGQSAPPLFLWLQKFVISNFPFAFWVNIKLISFLVSILTLLFFFKIIKKYNFNFVFFLLYSILIFNPFITYNSLTVKQYTFDLLGIVILLAYLNNEKFRKYIGVFFMFWTLFSNIGLFGYAGYLLFLFFRGIKKTQLTPKKLVAFILSFIRENLLTILSVLPYFLYFGWFMQQEGAKELKDYMTVYWSTSFMPMSFDLIQYWIFQAHGFWTYLYTMNEIIGGLLFFLAFSILLYCLMLKKKIYLFEELLLLSLIFSVHLFFNIIRLYPMSTRLYLYLSIPFLLLLGSSLKFFFEKFLRSYKISILVITAIILFSYASYFNYKENDIVSLYKSVDVLDEHTKVFATSNTLKNTTDFNQFTDNYFKTRRKLMLLEDTKSYRIDDFIISRVHNKLKPNKIANEESIIDELLDKNKIQLINKIAGYNIYRFKK